MVAQMKKGFLVLVVAIAAWVVGSAGTTGAARPDVTGFKCWDALVRMGLHSCEEEYALHIDSQQDVTSLCCEAINVLGNPDVCWPPHVMLMVVGFSPEEAHKITDHCRIRLHPAPVPVPPCGGGGGAPSPSYNAAAA